MAKARHGRTVPPRDARPREDERGQDRQEDWEGGEKGPPRFDVDVPKDEVTEGCRISEPIRERQCEQERAVGDLPPLPGRSLPGPREPSKDDDADDHQDEEVEGKVMRG